MRVLDLFSGGGGAGVGYHRAGFRVTGVDIKPHARYPYQMVVGDALEYLDSVINSGEIEQYALVHSSPPCQAGCSLTVGTNQSRGWGSSHAQLIPDLKVLLSRSGIPYVIEQPTGNAPIRSDITLCGEMWGLGVIRHRNFELGCWNAEQPLHKMHRGRVRGWRHGVYYDGPYVAAYGSGGGKASIEEMQQAMDITWLTDRKELTEAIPPAYTKWIGEQFTQWKETQ